MKYEFVFVMLAADIILMYSRQYFTAPLPPPPPGFWVEMFDLFLINNTFPGMNAGEVSRRSATRSLYF